MTQDAPFPKLEFSTHDAGAGLVAQLFSAELRKVRATRFRYTGWATDERRYAEDSTVIAHARYGRSDHVVLRLGEAIAYLQFNEGAVRISIGAPDAAATDEALEFLRLTIARVEPRAEPETAFVTFWAGGSCRARRLPTLDWPAIEANYPAATAEAFSSLLARREPEGEGEGQLILWHGPPGVGKTFALRALASGWREWCDVHYVVDAERFLGADAAGFLDVIAGSDEEVEEVEEMDRWRLIVLEDAGELLGADARSLVGQGLSRLLNVTDGLIGQGFKTLVLITTNEPVGRFHPAVLRPGRALASIAFEPLSAAEASEWLGEELERPMTIAELFALRGGGEAALPARATLGFAA